MAPSPSAEEIDDPISWKPSATFLAYIIGALMAGAVSFLFVIRIFVPDQYERAIGPLMVSLVAATGWYLLSRGRTQATIQVLAYGTWMAATVISAIQGGVRTPIIIAYPLIIQMIGWLISLRAAQVMASLTVAAIIGFVVGESWGYLPTPHPTPPAMHGVVQVIIVLTSTLFIVILVRAYQSHLRELRQLGNDLTRRTDELESNKAELNRAQAVAKVGSWVYDLPTDTMHLSPEACRIFGLPTGTEGSHDAYLTRLHPDDRGAVDRAWQAALEGESFDNEHRIVLDGEAVRWVRQKATLEFAPDGMPLRATGIAQDITEYKRIEDSLRTSSARLNEAQHIAQLGSWTLDLVSGDLIWSDEIFRLFEIDPTRFGATYEAFLGAIHPEDRDAVNRAYTESLASRSPYEISHRLLMHDGRIKWVQERCMTNFDAAGKPLQSHGTVQDITQRKVIEEQLRIAASAFQSMEGMVITDAKSVILQVNQAFTEITGYTAEEVLGQTPRLLQSGHHDANFYRSMWETIVRTGGWQGEVWDRRKNGEVYPAWITISAVKDDGGSVTHYVGAQLDITERRKAEERISELAFSDPLTGLPNRRLLLDRLKQFMSASTRSGSYGALLLIDLDNFKMLNDTQGHDMGDLLLKQVAQRLSTCVRADDTVARLGGDEFIVMLSNLSVSETDAAAQTEAVGQKILSTLNQTYLLNDVAYHSTPSIGATLFSGHVSTIDVLMKQADLAMYKSKETGRNTLHFFDQVMENVVIERAAQETSLRRAIVDKQFLLHYQAQVVGEGRITGAEVLVRWQHPQRGIVSPAEFIPLAEETGLILPLGQWILETACSQLALWAVRPELAHLTLAVNVSAHQFRQTDFVDLVLAVLKNTGANPQRLKLELTESLLVSNVEEVVEKMFALKAKGVGFSLDDFGTGYSSLSYLKRLPLDQLKIDQSFVRDVLSDPNDAAIAKTVIALAQSLGLGVIAEGVETALQRDFLLGFGCHAYQGYFFSRPLPLEGFEALAAPGQ